MLSNDLLIVTGALVGSSGAILSYIMCKAMNRHFISVIAGDSVLAAARPRAGRRRAAAGEVAPILAPETAELLREAKNVIIVPATAWRSRRRSTRSTRSRSTCARRASTCASVFTGSGPHAGPHERAARRSKGFLTTSCSRWTS